MHEGLDHLPPAGTSPLPLALADLHKVMTRAPSRFLAPLNAAMAKYEINTAKRVAAFLAQLAVESSELRHTHEQWTDRKDYKLPGSSRAAHTATSQKDYFSYWYGKRADLGNLTDEDGYTYRGRGAIQITGRANYERIGKAIGKPLKEQPDLLDSDDMADMIACAYFFAGLKHLNPVADAVDTATGYNIDQINSRITRAVNGGHNGLSERLGYYRRALKALNA